MYVLLSSNDAMLIRQAPGKRGRFLSVFRVTDNRAVSSATLSVNKRIMPSCNYISYTWWRLPAPYYYLMNLSSAFLYTPFLQHNPFASRRNFSSVAIVVRILHVPTPRMQPTVPI